jgi:rRNA maturation endonuclease Nob1
LLGYKDNEDKVEKIVTVNDKLQCKTCGKVNKSNTKFCSNCGTFLE